MQLTIVTRDNVIKQYQGVLCLICHGGHHVETGVGPIQYCGKVENIVDAIRDKQRQVGGFSMDEADDESESD